MKLGVFVLFLALLDLYEEGAFVVDFPTTVAIFLEEVVLHRAEVFSPLT